MKIRTHMITRFKSLAKTRETVSLKYDAEGKKVDVEFSDNVVLRLNRAEAKHLGLDFNEKDPT